MLNLCVFIFLIYAVSYSAKVILFGRKVKNQSRVCCSARSTTAETNTTQQRRKLSKPSIVKIRQTKAGRKGKSSLRPAFIDISYNSRYQLSAQSSLS